MKRKLENKMYNRNHMAGYEGQQCWEQQQLTDLDF